MSIPIVTIPAYCQLFRDRRLLIVFLLGMSSGLPWVLIGSTMSAWLYESGLTRTAIGVFGSITTLYAINFLWAPLLDRTRIPLIGRRLGQRRSWIFITQAAMVLGCVAISFTDPALDIRWTAVIALLIVCASATQDVAIDAYRIEIIDVDESQKLAAASAMATAGWWTGFGIPGALALALADLPGWSWGNVYLVLGLCVLLLLLTTLVIPEPKSQRQARQQADTAEYDALIGAHVPVRLRGVAVWLLVTVVQPFLEFFRRNGVSLALAIIGFVLLFKVGEAFMGRMSLVFYKDVGFSNTEIAGVSKLIGWASIMFFSLLSGLINVRFGIFKGLLIGGIAMASTNLIFALLAMTGPATGVFALAVIADNFTTALSTVTFVAFISALTSRVYTATQYALLASLGNLSRTTLAAGSGYMVDSLGGNWSLFFVITTLMVIPSLVLLLWLRGQLKARLGGAFEEDAVPGKPVSTPDSPASAKQST